MKVSDQMHISDAQTNDYFLNIKDLVTDLEVRHTCLTANTMMSLLDMVSTVINN